MEHALHDAQAQTDLDVIGRYVGVGSTDFWGISFAPSPLDREPFDAPTFDRKAQLLRAALSTPDVAQAVSAFANDWYETFGTTSLP